MLKLLAVKSRRGGERDEETGLDYRGARFYDADVGRFLSLDPLAGDFAAWSTYSYVFNNPLSFIDPDGRAPENIIITHKDDKGTLTEVTYGNDGNLYNADGSEYSGNNEFIKGVQATLNNLKSLDSRVDAVVTDLIKGSEDHSIKNFDYKLDGTANERNETYNIKSRAEGNEKGSLTKFVPDTDRARLKDETLSNEEILGHELKHAYNRKHGMQGSGYTENRIPNEEIDGVNFQNVIRASQGREPKTTFAKRDITKYLTPPSEYNNIKNEKDTSIFVSNFIAKLWLWPGKRNVFGSNNRTSVGVNKR